MQQLQDQIVQLEADNQRLRSERTASRGLGETSSQSSASLNAPAPGPVVTERLVVVPRDRRCPIFNGRSGVGINEWVEEVEACMRARHLTANDRALFIIDHLDGEPKQEIKFRPAAERQDPVRVLAILKELYGCQESYITLQQEFFARRQLEGESLQEFSLALMTLMERVKHQAPDGMPNAEVLLRDQFTEHVLDGSLRRELKQLIRRQATITLMELRTEAMRWEREGQPGGSRGRSYSLPSTCSLQCRVPGKIQNAVQDEQSGPTLSELMTLLKQQQEQLNTLTQTVVSLQKPRADSPSVPLVICRRCQEPGHYARDCSAPWSYDQQQPRRRGGSGFRQSRPFHSNGQSEN